MLLCQFSTLNTCSRGIAELGVHITIHGADLEVAASVQQFITDEHTVAHKHFTHNDMT